jgi:hypothetical protein
MKLTVVIIEVFHSFEPFENFIQHFSVTVAPFMAVFVTNFTITVTVTVVSNAPLVTMAEWLP